MIEAITIKVSAEITDKDRQELSYNILQLIKQNQNKPGCFGIIYIISESSNNTLKLTLVHKDLFKTICDVYYENLTYLSYITFSKIYADTQDAEYKDKINRLINLIKQVFK